MTDAADRAVGHGNPRIAELGRDFWEHGKGALWIRWGTPRATTRCHRLVMQHAGMSDENAWGYCAERHHAVTGRWPGEKAPSAGGAAKAAVKPAAKPAATPPQPAPTKPVKPAPAVARPRPGVKPQPGKKKRRDLELAPSQTRGAVEIGDDVGESIPAERAALAGQPETREVQLENGSSDGLNFSGYAAVFNFPAAIRDQQGEFLESIAPGAFAESLSRGMPKLLFNHGQHPLISDIPLGVITTAREDDHGLYIEARFSDNWLMQPVRDAIRDGAVSGMSFRFSVPEGGQKWTCEEGRDSRRILRADVSEVGPVVWPAYSVTKASIRSALDQLPVADDGTSDITGRPGTGSAGGGDQREAGQGAAHPSSDALQRDRILRMEGIIRG